jgi:hypothetical protein
MMNNAWCTPKQVSEHSRVREQIPKQGQHHIRTFIVDKIDMQSEGLHDALLQHPGLPQLRSQHPTSYGKPFVCLRITVIPVSRSRLEVTCEYGDEPQQDGKAGE